MIERVYPQTFEELSQLCQTRPHLLPHGGQTKPGLLARGDDLDLTLVDVRGLTGVVNYDPSEFLISARGGTSIQELHDVLAQQGQYLPFDPVLTDAGATLGGSIASGISGPSRLLYGSLRDFMLEVQLCDSLGREVRGGGKVVKNAAGFDLPKLVVGSYGRLGIITEATLKVFPQPTGSTTLRIRAASTGTAIDIATRLQALPLPIAAIEIDAIGSDAVDATATVWVRLSGPVDSLASLAARVLAALPGRGTAERIEHGPDEAAIWHGRSAMQWCSSAAAVVRVAAVHHQFPELCRALTQLDAGYQCVVSCGATVAWIAVPSLDALQSLDPLLSEQMLSAVAVRGPKSLTLLGDTRWVATAQRIQQALDPAGKWLPLADRRAPPANGPRFV